MGNNTGDGLHLSLREGCCLVFAVLALGVWGLIGALSEGSATSSVFSPPPVVECPFGYFDRPGDMEARCEPAGYRVQPGNTFSYIAEAWGSSRSWQRLCTVERRGQRVIVRRRATLANDQDLLPGQLVMLCSASQEHVRRSA